jgi:2,4-dienoyl-CoA reductase-like NADH-dependent reductase (Old Yellow Enzyme family)
MTDLFSDLSLRDVTARNRVMVSPMCQYSCVDRDGVATEWHRQHLESRAVGGAGIVMTEATAVRPDGRISPQDLGLWRDAHVDALEPITSFCEEYGALSGVQLAHAGHKGSKRPPWDDSVPLPPEDDGWVTPSPSATAYPWREGDDERSDDTGVKHVETMSTSDVATLVEDFAAAAERADDAGFDVVEVHAAHGYLLHEFLSPATNDREDQYGGSFEDRTRIVRKTAAAVRDAFPEEKPVFVRFSATDWLPDRDSWTVEDTAALAADLASDGLVDLVDVSAGGLHPDQEIPVAGPNYQVPYAERVREAVDGNALVGAVGGITTPEQADAVVRNDRADLAIVGRQHLRDPYFAVHAAEALDREDAVEWPRQYRRAV